MFMGEFSCKIDSKGRFMFPAKFRDTLNKDEFVITRGLDSCIDLYPLLEWKEMEDKLQNLKLTNKNHRAYHRFILSAATRISFDNQGRLSLPKSLLEHSKINKNLIVIGMDNKIEIWSEELWKEYIKETEESIEDLVNAIEF